MRKPDFNSSFAEIWEISLEQSVIKSNPDWSATLSQYLIKSDLFHPAWNHWIIALIHLRDIEGVKPAHKYYLDAEYEILCLAVDPTSSPNPDPDKSLELQFLTPSDITIQFDGHDDTTAIELMQTLIHAIERGKLSPDRDFESHWKDLILSNSDNAISARDLN